jgi:hypothetical protein
MAFAAIMRLIVGIMNVVRSVNRTNLLFLGEDVQRRISDHNDRNKW